MNEQYDVIFNGQINFTEDINHVKEKTQRAMKLSDAQLENFFSGKKIFLKKNLSFKDAQILMAKIETLGLISSSVPSTPPPSTLDLALERPQSTLQAALKVTGKKSSVMEDYDYDDEMDDQTLESSIPATFGLNLDGRFGPLNFLNAQLQLIFVLLPLGIIYIILIMIASPEIIINTYKISILIIYTLFSYRLVALRLQDLNKSHWLFAIFIAYKIPDAGPYIIFLFSLYLVFMPGSKEMNQYGPPTTQGSKLGIIAFFLLVPVFASAHYYFNQQQNVKIKLVADGIALTQALQTTIEAYYAENKELPTSLHQLNMSIMSPDPTVVIGVELTGNHAIKIIYSFKVQTEGYLTMVPIINGNLFSWRCHDSNLEEKIIPHQCQLEMKTQYVSDYVPKKIN